MYNVQNVRFSTGRKFSMGKTRKTQTYMQFSQLDYTNGAICNWHIMNALQTSKRIGRAMQNEMKITQTTTK